MKEVCPVCGSREIVCVDKSAKKYRCRSCDEIFVLEDKPKIVERIVEKTVEKQSDKKGLSPAEIYKAAIDSIFELSSEFGDEGSSGTGFYISDDGYIITNCHMVIGRNSSGEYVLCDDVYSCKSKSVDYYELQVIFVDPKNDLALLKDNESASVKALNLAKSTPEIGENIVAIGNSKGEGLALINGIVSDVGREFRDAPAFLFNALVSHGCSGGPILNDNGEVCGVTVGGREDAEGMKYGIPIETVRKFIKTAEIEKDIKIKLL